MSKPPPSYAPVYAAALYPYLATIARKHGYALAVHGSLQRDFDLVAVPWTPDAGSPEELIAAIRDLYAVDSVSAPDTKSHGRVAYSLVLGFGAFIDLSFMPRTEATP